MLIRVVIQATNKAVVLSSGKRRLFLTSRSADCQILKCVGLWTIGQKAHVISVPHVTGLFCWREDGSCRTEELSGRLVCISRSLLRDSDIQMADSHHTLTLYRIMVNVRNICFTLKDSVFSSQSVWTCSVWCPPVRINSFRKQIKKVSLCNGESVCCLWWNSLILSWNEKDLRLRGDPDF